MRDFCRDKNKMYYVIIFVLQCRENWSMFRFIPSYTLLIMASYSIMYVRTYIKCCWTTCVVIYCRSYSFLIYTFVLLFKLNSRRWRTWSYNNNNQLQHMSNALLLPHMHLQLWKFGMHDALWVKVSRQTKQENKTEMNSHPTFRFR